MPVVLDLPDAACSGDSTAIETIKRKLGINIFRGSIFDGADSPAQQLIKQDAPARLLSLNGTLACSDRCEQFGTCTTSACATQKTALSLECAAKADDNCPGATAATSIACTQAPPEPIAQDHDEVPDHCAIDVLRSSSL